MALPSNDINDLNRKRIIESSDVPGQPGVVVLNPDGTAVGAPVGGATSANQTNGTQKTQIVDAGGEAVTVTGGKLDVNATASLSGESIPISGATTAVGVAIVDGSGNQITSFGGGTQYTEGDVDATLTGTIAMAEGPSNTATPLQVDASNHLQVDIAAASTDITVQDGGGSLTVDNNGTFATQAAQSGTWNITNVSGTVSLPTGASTLAEQQSQTTHLSTIAGDTTSIQTAIELLDDTVATDGSATPTKGILMAGQDGTNAQTISTNSSGHINIADGGNTITVDGTVGVSGTVTADTELPTAVALADLSSNPTTTAVGSYLYAFDNGTGYNRLGLLNSGADGQNGGRGLMVGNMLFNGTSYDRERGDATNGTLVNLGSNNDVIVSNAAGASAVNIQDGGNSITVDYATTGSGTATGALRVELPTNGTGVIATVGAVTAITNALPAGTNAIGKLAANSGVDIGDVDVTSVVPGTGATNLGKAEDGAHTSGDVGVMDLGVRNDTMADFTGADNDYTPKSVTAKGQTLTANAPRGRKLHQITTITSSTSETTVLTAAASTYHDVYGIIVTNTSSTATEVSFKDATAGTTRFTISAPANDTRGFMVPVDAAVVQSATNNNWTATCADSVAAIIITVLAVKNI